MRTGLRPRQAISGQRSRKGPKQSCIWCCLITEVTRPLKKGKEPDSFINTMKERFPSADLLLAIERGTKANVKRLTDTRTNHRGMYQSVALESADWGSAIERTLPYFRTILPIRTPRLRGWCEERGPAVTKQSKQKRTARMIRQLRSLGYRIETPNPQPSQAQAQ
jgi:hypothetical protein